MNNVGIFGLGAIGSLLTKYLKNNKTNQCFFFNRSVKTEINIKFKGRVDSFNVKLSPIENHQLDWLIICLKEYHIRHAIPNITKLVNDNTKVVLFQNGINLSSAYKELSKESKLLETIIDCPIQKIKPNQFSQFKKPKITLPDIPLAKDFIKLFKNKDLEFKTTRSFIESQWVKLIESSAMGSIQSYTRKPCIIFKEDKYLQEYVELVKEGIQVAKSNGVDINSDLTNQLLIKLKGYPENKGSSMLMDKLAGNQLELNAKIGAIIKIGERNGIDIPVTKRIRDLL